MKVRCVDAQVNTRYFNKPDERAVEACDLNAYLRMLHEKHHTRADPVTSITLVVVFDNEQG